MYQDVADAEVCRWMKILSVESLVGREALEQCLDRRSGPQRYPDAVPW